MTTLPTTHNNICKNWMYSCNQASERLYNSEILGLMENTGAAMDALNSSFMNGEDPEEAVLRIRFLQAKELWAKLGDIPVNAYEEIDEPFLDFKKGEDIYEIWHWFEETFKCSVAKDLMGLQAGPSGEALS